MSDEVGHYDSIAGAFLSAGTTMIAIILGLIPIVRAQNALTGNATILYGVTTLSLVAVILLSIFGLVTKADLKRKRTLCVIPSVPLTVSLIFMLMLMIL